MLSRTESHSRRCRLGKGLGFLEAKGRAASHGLMRVRMLNAVGVG
jgi:hypothetical protein